MAVARRRCRRVRVRARRGRCRSLRIVRPRPRRCTRQPSSGTPVDGAVGSLALRPLGGASGRARSERAGAGCWHTGRSARLEGRQRARGERDADADSTVENGDRLVPSTRPSARSTTLDAAGARFGCGVCRRPCPAPTVWPSTSRQAASRFASDREHGPMSNPFPDLSRRGSLDRRQHPRRRQCARRVRCLWCHRCRRRSRRRPGVGRDRRPDRHACRLPDLQRTRPRRDVRRRVRDRDDLERDDVPADLRDDPRRDRQGSASESFAWSHPAPPGPSPSAPRWPPLRSVERASCTPTASTSACSTRSG